jgi:TorA maturation chaperone TorD
LAAWLPPLQAEAKSKLKHPFYMALIVLARHFVAHDAEAVVRDAANQDVWRGT